MRALVLPESGIRRKLRKNAYRLAVDPGCLGGGNNCYYFYPDSGSPVGSMAAGLTTPDGYSVNEQGRWCVDGEEQTR